jgi:hypothetical protein
MGTTLQDIDHLVTEVVNAVETGEVLPELKLLSDAVGEVVFAQEPAITKQTAARLESLLRFTTKSSDPAAVEARGAVELLLHQTTRSLNAARVEHAASRRRAQQGVLADNLVDALATHGPARTRELAARFDVHPSQISRALRQLEGAGRVKIVNGPSEDQRARYYELNRHLGG